MNLGADPSNNTSSADGFEVLQELAFNLRSAWNHRADALWEEIDPVMWREDGQPLADRAIGSAYEALRDARRRALSGPYYLHAASAFARRRADGARPAAEIAGWGRTMKDRWRSLRFGDIRVRTEGGQHRFETSLYLGEMDPDWIAVELYADGRGEGGPVRTKMRRAAPLVGARGFAYEAEIPDSRPPDNFTPRAVASHPEVIAPLEVPLILWAR